MTGTQKYLPIIAFVLLGVIWGGNYIYMKMASKFIIPTQIVFLRVLFGLIPIFIYALFTKSLRWSHFRHIHHFFVMSLLAAALYFYGLAKGTSMLWSGMAGALCGAIPLFTFVLAVIFIHEEKATIYRIVGTLIGFIGVAIVALPPGHGLQSANIEGVLYMVGGAFSLGASFVYAKIFIKPLNIPATALVTYQLALALAVLSIVIHFEGMSNIWTNAHAAVGLTIGLGLLGTGVGYTIYYYLVDKMGAVTASSVTYIPPVIALIIGAVIVGEPIEVSDYFATLLIFGGVYLLRRKQAYKKGQIFD